MICSVGSPPVNPQGAIFDSRSARFAKNNPPSLFPTGSSFPSYFVYSLCMSDSLKKPWPTFLSCGSSIIISIFSVAIFFVRVVATEKASSPSHVPEFLTRPRPPSDLRLSRRLSFFPLPDPFGPKNNPILDAYWTPQPCCLEALPALGPSFTTPRSPEILRLIGQ